MNEKFFFARQALCRRSVVARWLLGGRSVSGRQTCSATARRMLLGISGVERL